MKRIIIICEGDTEQEFCQDVLAPHFARFNMTIDSPSIKKSHGGIVPWNSLKTQIIHHLGEDNSIVTLLIDYYGIKEQFQFPGWEDSFKIENKQDRIHFLLKKMKMDIPDDLRYRFYPYIQLHEFEGLLFSDISAFKDSFEEDEANFKEIESTILQFDSPEDINSSPKTAPSKRLIMAIPGYDKVVYGSCLAEKIGLDTIRSKCPLFNEWLTSLEKINTSSYE